MDEKKTQTIIQKISKTVLEFLYNLLVIILLVVVIRTFLVTPFRVTGSSMFPTLYDGDYIIVNKLSYHFSQPEFGDIIVLSPPQPKKRRVGGLYCLVVKFSKLNFSQDACIIPDVFIKRIIGLPGDIISIRDGEVYRNDEKIDESKYLDMENNKKTYVLGSTKEKIYEVPEGEYFVLGDNRNGSSDSRDISRVWRNTISGQEDHYINRSDIEGKLLLTLLSPTSIRQYLSF